MDRNGSFAPKASSGDIIDQGLHRLVAVYMDKDLPVVRRRIGKFRLEKSQINRRIAAIIRALAGRRDWDRIMQPRSPALRTAIDRQLDPADAEAAHIRLADHCPHLGRPFPLERDERDRIHDQRAAFGGFRQRRPGFGHNPAILRRRNPVCGIDPLAREQSGHAVVKRWRWQDLAQPEQRGFLHNTIRGLAIGLAPDHSALGVGRVRIIADQPQHRRIHHRKMPACMADHDRMLG